MRDLIIGCDVGTSGAKAVAMSADGKVLAVALENYGLITPRSQWAEQWPQVWLDAATAVIGQVVGKIDASRVACVCMSALYGGTGAMLDKDMNPVYPALIWMDRRAEEESRLIAESIGADALVALSGNGIDSYFGYVKLLWMQRHEPDIWKKVRHIVPIHSYLIYQMTGSLAVDYCSAGNVGGFYDVGAACWSKEMCGRLGIDADTLPQQLCEPSRLVGELNGEYAAKLGLPPGTPFAAGTVDCIASMLSAGVVADGDNAAVLGTSLNWGYIHHNRPNDPNLVSMPYCIDPTRTFYTYGGASTAGALPRWLLTQLLGGESKEMYDTLQSEVERQKIPAGSDGLLVLPYFMGERTPIWDENATGLMMGLSLRHTRAHIYRAILESAAYSLRHIMDSMSGEKQPDHITLVGGGAKSTLWRQIFADVTGVPVLTTVDPVEAPLGDAFLAAMASGLQTDFSAVRDWVHFNPPVTPNEQAHATYNGYYQTYRDLYPTLRDDMHRLKRLAD